jgi:predicted dehydrogenase
MISQARPRGVVVATPNATHADIAVRCMELGAAVIVEKPIADELADARRICAASKASGQAALVGHQRRHNPIARRAHQIIAAGGLGRLVCATALCTWLKPAPYFDAEWRRKRGGGPMLINLIHDVDLLRFLCGEVESVQAMSSNAVRGYEVEDTAAVLLRFRGGALGAITVSDTAAAPWNWDLAAGEAERFPRQDVDSHYLSGTEGSLTLPRLELWRYGGRAGWEDPISAERTALHASCPYAEQLRHFRAVIEGREAPVCSAEDATRTLEVTLAARASCGAGERLQLGA